MFEKKTFYSHGTESLIHPFVSSDLISGVQTWFSPAPLAICKHNEMSPKPITKFFFYKCCVSNILCSQDTDILIFTNIQKKTAEARALSYSCPPPPRGTSFLSL